MKRVSEFVKWYLYITSGILIVTAIGFAGNKVDSLPAETLWNILLSGFLTTLVTVLSVFVGTRSKAATIIKFLVHYLALCVVMVLCGSRFGWVSLNVEGVVTMMLSVAAVYILAFGAYCLIDLKQAKDINDKLKEKYGDDQ